MKRLLMWAFGVPCLVVGMVVMSFGTGVGDAASPLRDPSLIQPIHGHR